MPDRAEARMLSAMPGQIDARHRRAEEREHAVAAGGRIADERQHGSVVVRIRSEVEHLYARNGAD